MPRNKKKKKRSFFSKLLIVFLILTGFAIAGAYPGYLLTRYAFNKYFEHWGEKLVNLEKRGLLSKEYGAGWQDVLTDKAMATEAQRITDSDSSQKENEIKMVDGIVLADYPSLSIVARLNEVRKYTNSIAITDRLDRPIVTIRTDHQRARYEELPPTLVTALIAAEDGNYWENNLGFEFDSFVRAAIQSVKRSVFSFRGSHPRGTSTITQQVAKLFISRLDESGNRRVSRSVNRKIRELRLAVALRKIYSAEDILEVYCNHCVTSSYGLIGYKDIARGLFEKDLDELTDAECVYLARMVKWGVNIKSKIKRQCRIDMPRMAGALDWDGKKQKNVLETVDSLTFSRPVRYQGDHHSLVDVANEFWLDVLKKNGSSGEQLEQMNIIDPNSLIRKKGNLKIRLTIDLPLQRQLEKLVNARGYGEDTTLISYKRLAQKIDTVTSSKPPKDSKYIPRILRKSAKFEEPETKKESEFEAGDTIAVSMEHKKIKDTQYLRATTYYSRKSQRVDGQYFAYSIMDSRSGQLLAYYSRDRLGSRLACLLKNRTPNGSSTAKPILNALNFDLGNFAPYERWTDTLPVTTDVPWKRSIEYRRGKPVGVAFDLSGVRGRPYKVHNHGFIFEGCNYVFEHLATSNNILGAETIYRLNQKLFDRSGKIHSDAFPVVQYLYRIGAFSRVKDSLQLKSITGVRAYKELARIVGADVDYAVLYGKRIPVPDTRYSVSLGTLELTLYEQMHLFNALYNNALIENPAKHPSLTIDTIVLNGNDVPLNDTIRRYHPFVDISNIRPTHLGMHLRLVSNKWDGISDYDIAYQRNVGEFFYDDGMFHREAYSIDDPLSNYAKSGTSDDVIRPFNVSRKSSKRTNYGIWNAVVRIDLSAFDKPGKPSDIRDITVACIGECNRKYTGARDGKSLHKFLTMGLLKKAGIKAPGGFFAQYESYLRRTAPPSESCDPSIIKTEIVETPYFDTLAQDSMVHNTVDNAMVTDSATTTPIGMEQKKPPLPTPSDLPEDATWFDSLEVME